MPHMKIIEDLYPSRCEAEARFLPRLENKPGVEHVAFFGAKLHVSGRDGDALRETLAPFASDPEFTIEEAEPSLEDVFIHLQNPEGRPVNGNGTARS